MKYEEVIEKGANEAHNIILEQIRPGSKVLEFGSAGGRMTKILKNEMDCCVFIVEYERCAFKKAMEFADKGLCSDIEQLKWKRRWKHHKFDYIIFADVLEHLRDPLSVLSETYDLLKNDGSVLISIPNVAHNDILIKLYNNHFDYTDIGILDNTHLHFWAEENLEEFERKTEYQIYDLQYKTIPTWTTEQFQSCSKNCLKLLQELLPQRINGEVYQFILNLKKKEYMQKEGLFRKTQQAKRGYCLGRLYYDRGNGFSQVDSKTVIANIDENGRYYVKIKEKLDDNVQRLRYDMLEGEGCVVYGLCAMLDGLEEAQIISEYLENSNKIMLLDSEDPQLVFDNTNGKSIEITMEFSISKNDICEFYREICEELSLKFNKIEKNK